MFGRNCLSCSYLYCFVVFFIVFSTCAFSASAVPNNVTRPYDLTTLLNRGEELFKINNYADAIIFYSEALDQISDPEIKSKVHFRLGECLEGVRRYDFAAYHYKLAITGSLPEVLASRVMTKLKALPRLAQHEEAMRLFKKAMSAYKKRDIRGCVDDYLKSLQLEPTLMGQDESGLIDDAIQYLTYLSENKENEPRRLLKLATLLELRGDTEKSLEALKQILIIYPNSSQAKEAEEKVVFYTQKKNSFVEFKRPKDALAEVIPQDSSLIFETDLEFHDPGIISKDLSKCAFTFKAANEMNNIPEHRFEVLTISLGKGENQKEFLFKADEGISEKTVSFDDADVKYIVTFQEVNLTTAYIQDIYGEGVRATQLYSQIQIHLSVVKK